MKKQSLRGQADKRSLEGERAAVGTLVVQEGGKRSKVVRRRQIDPTTCEREYSADELEFMRALDEYKRASGRMFPTCSEILEVVRGLGYVRVGSTGATSNLEPISGG